jgi:hypothetical protein
MTQGSISGQIRVVHAPDGVDAEFYIIPFDKRGVCTGPTTRDLLLQKASAATDIFVFSHGWNNTWKDATAAYDRFIAAYLSLRTEQWSNPDRDYKPLLVGVFWPSTALVAPWEEAPDIAADDATGPAPTATGTVEFAEGLPLDKARRFYELSDRATVSGDEATELAALVCSVLGGDDEIQDAAPGGRDPADLVAAWQAASQADQPPPRTSSASGQLIEDDDADYEGADIGHAGDRQAAGADSEAPIAAGFGLSDLDPRNLIRLATVLLMKDRAGTVGSKGVADLLQDLEGPARIHLVGHSYGAKVVLSALRARDSIMVDSVLLLQPAVSAYCFAPAGGVPGTDHPGGYAPTLTRSRQPILATFSRHDVPLHSAFQLAARRHGDLGEADVAADEAPSRYSALGGYGPLGLNATMVDAVRAPARYRFPPDHTAVIGIRSNDVIGGHGDVTSAATAWMLLDQVRS